MSVELITAISSVVVTLITTVSALFMRSKYKAEVETLQANVTQLQANADGTRIDNSQKIVDMLNKDIVEPLRQEVKNLRNEVNKFRKAVEKIPSCLHARDNGCPVRDELQNHANDNNGK